MPGVLLVVGLVGLVGWAWWKGALPVSTVTEPPRIRSLDSLSAGFRPLAEKLLLGAEAIGVPLTIVEARRSNERQAWLFGQGRPGYQFNGREYGRAGEIVTKAQPGRSRHETGDAIDVWPKGLGYSAADVKAATALLEKVERDVAAPLGLKNEPIPGDHAHFQKA